MQVREDIHVEWVGNEAVALDPNTKELHYLNPPAALVYALLAEHGFEEGIRAVKRSFGSEEGIEEDLGELLQEMVEKGLLINE